MVFVPKAWPAGQRTVALSSAEAELYAMMLCVSEVFGLKKRLREFGVHTQLVAHTGLSTTSGIKAGVASGTYRHLQVAVGMAL